MPQSWIVVDDVDEKIHHLNGHISDTGDPSKLV
jgi:hypothetical protein